MNILDFLKFKQRQRKITWVTCYDFWSAQIMNATDVDCLLVGDSAAMVMHGYATTVPATVELQILHTQAVAKGAPDKFIIGDMPFLANRLSLRDTMLTVQQLMQAGAHAIKIEAAAGNLETINTIVEAGVPIMGHLGLTPQAIHALGGFKVQGKNNDAAAQLLADALALQQAGCSAIVLECVPTLLAAEITQALTIPTIGIGAGHHTDGQVLVLQDLLGLQANFKPKFVKHYLNGFELFKNAVNDYCSEVRTQQFPNQEQSYHENTTLTTSA